MRILHYIEIENFKGFGDRQRIELDHPAVLIGPNNCGKTTAVQAIALWSQAVQSWYAARHDSTAKERTAVALNRLAIVSVPVQRTRYFWHDARTRVGNSDIHVFITAGVPWKGAIRPLRLRFRNQGEELVYCNPEPDPGADVIDLDFIAHAATIKVHLLYSMSGLEIEEPVLTPGRIDVLLGQGQTAQVLRNLCLLVLDADPKRWDKVAAWMHRLFGVRLTAPKQNARGSIDLAYEQDGVREPLDLAMAGRGFLQMLLILSYLYSHQGGVLLIDEPDAHFEILRQKQVYVLLRDIATETSTQVVIVTHSEVVLEEALDRSLTLILDGKVENLTSKGSIRNSLKHFGTGHYVKARTRGHVLYVEGSTDVDMLRALARRLGHRVSEIWDERANVFYVQDNYPVPDAASELERVEGGFGVSPREHFFGIRSLVPEVRGLAILDNDGKNRIDTDAGGLKTAYWRRYEAENYFITPELLLARIDELPNDLFAPNARAIANRVLDQLTLERVFAGVEADHRTYQDAPRPAARLIWDATTARIKLSNYAEEFFRQVAAELRMPMVLSKGELHQLVATAEPAGIPAEVSEKLDLLLALWSPATS